MSQPASFDSPRPGEWVLACPHILGWKHRCYYIGQAEHVTETFELELRSPKSKENPRQLSGLGSWVRIPGQTEGFWCRWVALCWQCRLRRRITRANPIRLARRRMEWRSTTAT